MKDPKDMTKADLAALGERWLSLGMLVRLLASIEHLGGSCLRTDLIELQFRIAGDKIPMKKRTQGADRFRHLLDEAHKCDLITASEEGFGVRLQLTTTGRGLVGYAGMNGPDGAATVLLNDPDALKVFKKIAHEGVSAVPIDNRGPKK